MTKAQEEAFAKIREIGREHFEGFIFSAVTDVIPAEVPDHDADKLDEVSTEWFGGRTLGIGLIEIARHRLINSRPVKE